jgi:polyisoprenoid-binding protein YceI
MIIAFKSAGLAAVASLALLGTAHAQGASVDPSTVMGGTYAVEPGHTQILFKINHMGFTNYYGNFSGASGMLRLDPKNAAVDSLAVTVPVDSVSTTSAKLNDELKSADWFDAAKYPTMSFRSHHVTQTSPGHALVEGELTMHGVTRPVTLDAHLVGSGPNPMSKAFTVGFEVTGRVKRSDFGVTKYVPLVSDEVELMISGAFERQPG